jgi:hypothetical protein
LLPTVERLSLAGSAWKRLALIERLAGETQAELDCTVAMEAAYGDAVQKAESTQPDSWDRPAINQLAAQVRRCRLDRKNMAALDTSLVTRLRSVLTERSHVDPDFWSESGLIEVDLYEHLVGRPGRHRCRTSPTATPTCSAARRHAPSGAACPTSWNSCWAPGLAQPTQRARRSSCWRRARLRRLIRSCSSAPTPWRTT